MPSRLARIFLLTGLLAMAPSAGAQRLFKDLQLEGTSNQLKAGATFTLANTATFTAASGSTMNLGSTTLTLPAAFPVLDTTATKTDGDLFVWRSGVSKWTPKTLTAGDGISFSQTATTITVTASAGSGVVGNQTANTVFSGPASGSAAPSLFRALVTADLPASGITAGTYGPFTISAKGTVTAASGSFGTVSSVAVTLPSIFAVTGSPVTTSGTLSATLATQSANTVFRGPSSGSAAAPTFGALVAADLPASGVSAGSYGDSTHTAQITVNAAGVITAASNVAVSGGGGGGGGGTTYVKITDTKTAGTSGGTFTGGSWQTRDLTTIDIDPGSIASLTSNQITLGAGTYDCLISAPAYATLQHKARLRNITASTDVLVGSQELASGAQTSSVIRGRFTLGGTTVLEVQHYARSTSGSTGYGTGDSSSYAGGEPEVYTVAEFWKQP